MISLGYWLFGQGMGDLTTTQATDVNAGPLFILLALALMPRPTAAASRAAARSEPAGALPA